MLNISEFIPKDGEGVVKQCKYEEDYQLIIDKCEKGDYNFYKKGFAYNNIIGSTSHVYIFRVDDGFEYLNFLEYRKDMSLLNEITRKPHPLKLYKFYYDIEFVTFKEYEILEFKDGYFIVLSEDELNYIYEDSDIYFTLLEIYNLNLIE